jgi:ketosteroid isomerase-like protein
VGENKPTLSAEIDAIRQAYAALNRGDVPGFVQMFDPQIERIERLDPVNFPSGRIYRGLAEVTQHVSKGRATWAEGGCHPQEFIVAGDRVIVLVDVRVRVKDETQWRQGRVADGYAFRNGKAIEFHTFSDERQARQWAGIEPRMQPETPSDV